MGGLSRGRMKKLGRHITSLLLTSIYVLVVLTPLAPLALQSRMIAHTVTGDCSGDCRIDGCSLERSAAHTCCCWQKKLSGQSEAHQQEGHDCCGTQASKSPPSSGSDSVAGSTACKKRTVISSTPCGSGKLFTLSSGEKSYHLPFSCSNNISAPEQNSLTFLSPNRLTSRHGEPPDPPPIIILRS